MSTAASTAPHHTAETYRSTVTPTGRVGMWWFLASEIAIFGGLIACYLLARLSHSEWAEYAAHTVGWAGALNTVVLLTSSLTIVLAHRAAGVGDVAKAVKLLWITVGCGGVFLLVKSYEYTHEVMEGFTPTTNLFWSYYFLMTGLHAFHVVGGMVAIALIARAASKGRLISGIEYAGIYWHFVDVVWVFLFPLVYLAS